MNWLMQLENGIVDSSKEGKQTRLIEDAPSYVEIKCSVKRNKAIGNNKITPTKR